MSIISATGNGKRSRAEQTRAFTLIELVVVIVIVAILATVAAVAYNSSINQFETSATESEAAQVSKLYQATSAANQEGASALVANDNPGPG